MDNGKEKRRVRKPSARRLAQLYSALLYNAHLKGFLTGQLYQGGAKYACVPGLNCYSCPGATAACPLGAIQNALGSSGHRAGWYAAGILLLWGVILGRTVCGWLCPVGLAQELLHKIPGPKVMKSRFTQILSRLKYLILAVFVAALPLWYGLREDLPMPAFCKFICPAGTSEGALGLLSHPANSGLFGMLGDLFTSKFVILAVICMACVFCYRAFCRFLCPLGAIYSLFNRFNIIGVRVDQDRCNSCGACVRTCEMDVRFVGDGECIHCGKCMAACAQGAISLKAGKITLKGPETGPAPAAAAKAKKRIPAGRILHGAAAALLCFAVLWFNVLDPAVRQETAAAATESYDSSAPVGHEAGQQLADFTLPCYDGTVFHLADCRGKIVFINFWATYCTPCKQELPYFSELAAARGEDVEVLVLHSSLVTDDPEAYLAGRGFGMRFATDADGLVESLVGGNGTYPQTVVLNRRGEVVYNGIGSVTPDMLEALYRQAEESSE